MNSNLLNRVKIGAKQFKSTSAKLANILLLTSLSLIAGCDDSSEKTDGTGYFKLYNASQNSPEIYLNIDEDEITQAVFSKSSALYPMESQSYQLELLWKDDIDSYNEFYLQELNITDDDISLVVITGDFEFPEVFIFDYYDQEQDLIDDDEEEQFAINLLNLTSAYTDLELYISLDNQTFNEAVLVQTMPSKVMSESHTFELESYVLYITAPESSEVIYQSASIDYFYNSQYVFAVRDNDGIGESPITVDRIARNGSVDEIPDKDSSAELRVYNGLERHELLEAFDNNIDVRVSGLNEQKNVIALAKNTMSETIELSSGDYSLDFLDTESSQVITSNHFVSLEANQDKTLFVYLSEEYEDSDNDSTTPDETKIYLNSLPVENSNRVSLYDHQVKVINLIQDADEQFSSIDIYFVRSDETVSSAEYELTSTHASPRSIVLPNNTYQISVIAEIDQSERLLIIDNLTLDSESGDLFMLIEENEESSEGYSIQFIAQGD